MPDMSMWCEFCAEHVGTEGPPWERTYESVHGKPCPIQNPVIGRSLASRRADEVLIIAAEMPTDRMGMDVVRDWLGANTPAVDREDESTEGDEQVEKWKRQMQRAVDDDDTEGAHVIADHILLRIVKAHGHHEVAALYEKVSKCYA